MYTEELSVKIPLKCVDVKNPFNDEHSVSLIVSDIKQNCIVAD